MKVRNAALHAAGIKTAADIEVDATPYWFGVNDRRDGADGAHAVPATLQHLGLAAAAAAIPSAKFRGITGRSIVGTAGKALANVVAARPISHGMPTVAGRAAQLGVDESVLQNFINGIKTDLAGGAAGMSLGGPLGAIPAAKSMVGRASDFVNDNPEAVRRMALDAAVGGAVGGVAGGALQAASNYGSYQLGQASTHEDDSLWARLKRSLK